MITRTVSGMFPIVDFHANMLITYLYSTMNTSLTDPQSNNKFQSFEAQNNASWGIVKLQIYIANDFQPHLPDSF